MNSIEKCTFDKFWIFCIGSEGSKDQFFSRFSNNGLKLIFTTDYYPSNGFYGSGYDCQGKKTATHCIMSWSEYCHFLCDMFLFCLWKRSKCWVSNAFVSSSMQSLSFFSNFKNPLVCCSMFYLNFYTSWRAISFLCPVLPSTFPLFQAKC